MANTKTATSPKVEKTNEETPAEKPARKSWKREYETLNTAFMAMAGEYFNLEQNFHSLIDDTNEFSKMVAGMVYEITGALTDLEDELLANAVFARKPKKVMDKSAEALNRAIIAYNTWAEETLDKYQASGSLIEATVKDVDDDAEE